MMLTNFSAFPQSGVEPLTLTKDGVAVARPDRVYDLEGRYVAFDELTLLGNVDGVLTYRGKSLTLCHAMEQIGILVDSRGPRGPVLRGVLAKIEGA